MTTYDLKKVISDYAHEHITPEMAVGHALQHLDHLAQTQTTMLARQQELGQKITELTQLSRQLQGMLLSNEKQFDQQQTVINSLMGLNITVYQLKNEVDSLKIRLT